MSDIPAEVKATAHSAVMRAGAFSPLALGDVHDAWVAVESAAPVIAEWARKEALREAAEAIDNLPGSDATGYYASEAHGGYHEAQTDAESAILALAGGATA